MNETLKKMQESIVAFKKSKNILDEAGEKAAMERIEKFYTKAAVGEVYNTEEDNYGKETIQTGTINSGKVLELNQSNVNFSNIFAKGNMGSNLPQSTDFITLADTGLLDGASETATNASFSVTASEWENTDKVNLKLGFFDKTIRLSRQELDYSVMAIDNLLKLRLQNRVANTYNALILNADSDATKTNINATSDTVAPDANAYFLKSGNDGLRKKGIVNGIISISTLSKASFTELLKKVTEYSDARGDLKVFMDKATALLWEDVLLEELKYVSERAIIDGYIGTYKGIDFIATRWLWLVNADGVVDVDTPTNNVYGQMLLSYTPAVVHGYGARTQDINTESNTKGDLEMTVISDMGIAVANEQAGLYKTTALGIVTL